MNTYKDTLYQDRFGKVINEGHLLHDDVYQSDCTYWQINDFLGERKYAIPLIIDCIVDVTELRHAWAAFLNFRFYVVWDYANRTTYVINLDERIK